MIALCPTACAGTRAPAGAGEAGEGDDKKRRLPKVDIPGGKSEF